MCMGCVGVCACEGVGVGVWYGWGRRREMWGGLWVRVCVGVGEVGGCVYVRLWVRCVCEGVQVEAGGGREDT